MSDMSFNQARELAERLELTEVTLKQTLKNIDGANKTLDVTLAKQENIIKRIPRMDKQLNIMKFIVATNIGFVLGLLVAKYII